MKYILLLAFLIPITGQCQQNYLPESMLCSSVLIQTYQGGSLKGQGSGVFISDSNAIYFLTARHVLFSPFSSDTTTHLQADSAKLTFYPHNVISDEAAIITLDLKGEYNDSHIMSLWNADIALILIAHRGNKTVTYSKHVYKNRSTFINEISIYSILSYQMTQLGGEVYLFGYPGSIGNEKLPQFDYTRPLLRKGIIAGKYEKNKTIIIDSPSYFGNSGGPVWEVINENGKNALFLIGVLSEYVPFIDKWENIQSHAINTQMMNSGYSVVTPVDYVFSLISHIKK